MQGNARQYQTWLLRRRIVTWSLEWAAALCAVVLALCVLTFVGRVLIVLGERIFERTI